MIEDPVIDSVFRRGDSVMFLAKDKIKTGLPSKELIHFYKQMAKGNLVFVNVEDGGVRSENS